MEDGDKPEIVKEAETEPNEEPSDSPTSTTPATMNTAREESEDASSVHSLPNNLPTVQVTPDSPTSPQSSPASPVSSSLSASDRRLRHRSAIEPRSSSRLSGFFTHLIHRRDPLREDPQPSPRTPTHPERDDAPSPTPTPPRSATPPPTLPPPSLHELGLSLSVVTTDLSPSHFSTPPTSGTFLAPHFLLLCHAQGLDVLPLVSPPASQPYALVRRVSFKSVVVMEQRGVLVAIAGRRDGVRVYALEEVKRAVEWRIEVELKRERERNRREMVKKIALGTLDGPEFSDRSLRKASLSNPPSPGSGLNRKGSSSSVPASTTSATIPLVPRTPTLRRPPKLPGAQQPIPTPPPPILPTSRPPSYSAESSHSSTQAIRKIRSRGGSISNVLSASSNVLGTSSNGRAIVPTQLDPDAKPDWDQSSDDEAINIVAAASSGSQALDERTSAQPPVPSVQPTTIGSPRRNRPANLDLSSLGHASVSVPAPEPSPVPTLWTLRQALSISPIDTDPTIDQPNTPSLEVEEEDGNTEDGNISLAQALLESRLPNLPPAGTQRPQQPILIASQSVLPGEEDQNSPRTSDSHSVPSRTSSIASEPPPQSSSRRRRWSVILTQSISSTSAPRPSDSTPGPSPTRSRSNRLARTQSHRSNQSARTIRAAPSQDNIPLPAVPPETAAVTPTSAGRSRFIPRIISSAFGRAAREDLNSYGRNSDSELSRKTPNNLTSHAPPPKLEYVKLPGTKGALMIKAVETPKKSFLAILCGDNGEKVELFAGTYRTALGLSRTFILPDSPRSLELQLQGDDLVEVFLVFSQNVFGLEPATVRVREVRIGRAERRAARRRAREIRGGEQPTNDSETPAMEEETNVNVSIGVSVSIGSQLDDGADPEVGSTLIANQHPSDPPSSGAPLTPNDSNPNDPNPNAAAAHAEELVALATAQMGPYTSFQQLGFSPRFPLASIADEYVIPPTYPDFLCHRSPGDSTPANTPPTDLAQLQFSPPGLPIPAPAAPCKWCYRDPKHVVHGPWKASLMQAWYKDGLLPPDLPVKREGETDYILLKELRQQCVDPTHPFRNPPVPASPPNPDASNEPLLPPISLLAQPRHFGPPALFFSSRGGHSTTIVDARGRSVLKGRFMWSQEEQDDEVKTVAVGRMGDVKRIEAFDVDDRSVLVAMRQGGLEAVDLSDALLRPADDSRTVLPQFDPPPSNISRRRPFVWKIGTPVSSSPTSATVLSSKKSGFSQHLPGKKPSTGPSKSPASKTDFAVGDSEEFQDEVLYLGRKDNELYLCERNSGFFRILRLCPT